MNKILEKAIAGALAGLIGTIKTDIDAFEKSKNIAQDIQAFDWKLAGKRYAWGIVLGVAAAFGLTGMLSGLGVAEGV